LAPTSRRRSVLRFTPTAAAIAVFAVIAGCSGGGGDQGGAGGRTTTPDGKPVPAFSFNITAAEVQSPAAQPPPFPGDLQVAVKSTLDTWLANGIAGPLQNGRPPAGLDNVFTAAAAGRLAIGQADRLTLLEEGTPVSGKVTQDRANVKFTALVNPAGAPTVVVAQVDFAVKVKGKGTTLTSARTGEVALVFDNNAWRIDSYDLRTARDTK